MKGTLSTIVVENRAGGGSSIALNYVAQQPPDGHTLLVGSTSTLVLREGGNNRAYDALKDIRSVSITICAALLPNCSRLARSPIFDCEGNRNTSSWL